MFGADPSRESEYLPTTTLLALLRLDAENQKLLLRLT